MKIEAVSLSLPSWKLNNEEVVDLIRHNSKPTFEGNLDKALRKASIILDKTGAKERYWLSKEKDEKPIDHIKNSIEQALLKANMSKNDIDLLIYVGIGRGFAEPGNSYLVAKAMGMNSVRCFDVIDACMSWTATMQIVDSLFKSNSYKNAMIVNGEFTVHGGPLFKNYSLRNEQQLEYTFPTFTVGEGATCTILTPKNSENFTFKFSSRADLADLCVIPTPEYKQYCDMTDKTGNNGAIHFSSYGYDLHKFGEEEIVKLFNSMSVNKEKIDIVFTHASSKNEWQKYGDTVGIGNKIYHIYHRTGNLVSASVPAAMFLAEQEGKLKRGAKVLSWVGSAGMSFNGTLFEF
ncbi:MAG: hypothetical protein KGQ36_01675 [Rickettsiales bacterium]|nr:hypothetical protein [Rickettsiales bacterium]